MRRTAWIIALLALTAAPLAAPAQVAIGPAAVVNDRVVTNFDVAQRARLLRFNGAADDGQLARIAFDQLVEDQLKLHAGEQAGIGREDVDADAAVRSYAEARGLTVEQLAAALERAGTSLEPLRDALAAEGVWRQVVQRRFAGRTQPSEGEIDQEVALAARSGNVSYHLAEIAIPAPEGREAEAAALAERAAAEIARGGDFAEIARRYSRAPSAAQGGDIGWLPRAGLPPEAQAALAEVRPGGVTRPFRTPNAVAILRLIERREAPALTAEDARDPERREALARSIAEDRLQRYAAGYLQELRGDAVIEMR